MIEFAISIGVLGALLIGAITLGRYAYDRMIVREAVEESAKLAMVDRPRGDSNGNHVRAWQMSNADLLAWQQTAANTMDSSIALDDIQPVGGSDPWKYSDKPLNAPGANGPQGFIKQIVDEVNGLLSDAGLPTISEAGFTRAINPGAETMKVTFRYNPGLSADLRINSQIDYDFTRYTMFTLPFSPEEAGDFPGNH